MKYTLITGQSGIGKSNAASELSRQNGVALIDLASKELDIKDIAIAETLILDHLEADFDKASEIFNLIEGREKEIKNILVITQAVSDLNREPNSWDHHLDLRFDRDRFMPTLYKNGRCVSRNIKPSELPQRLEELFR